MHELGSRRCYNKPNVSWMCNLMITNRKKWVTRNESLLLSVCLYSPFSQNWQFSVFLSYKYLPPFPIFCCFAMRPREENGFKLCSLWPIFQSHALLCHSLNDSQNALLKNGQKITDRTGFVGLSPSPTTWKPLFMPLFLKHPVKVTPCIKTSVSPGDKLFRGRFIGNFLLLLRHK